MHKHALTHIHTHTHTHTLAVSRDGTARLWDCGSAHCLAKMASLNHPIHSCSLTSSEIVAQRNTTLAEGILYSAKFSRHMFFADWFGAAKIRHREKV